MSYMYVIAQLGKNVLREVVDVLRQVQPDVRHQLVHRGVCCQWCVGSDVGCRSWWERRHAGIPARRRPCQPDGAARSRRCVVNSKRDRKTSGMACTSAFSSSDPTTSWPSSISAVCSPSTTVIDDGCEKNDEYVSNFASKWNIAGNRKTGWSLFVLRRTAMFLYSRVVTKQGPRLKVRSTPITTRSETAVSLLQNLHVFKLFR